MTHGAFLRCVVGEVLVDESLSLRVAHQREPIMGENGACQKRSPCQSSKRIYKIMIAW